MFAIKLTTVGKSTGLILPRQVLARLKVRKGEKLLLVETPRGYEILPHHPEFERQMQASEGGMRRFQAALRELGK